MMMSCFTAAGYSAAANQATKAPQSCATKTQLQSSDTCRRFPASVHVVPAYAMARLLNEASICA